MRRLTRIDDRNHWIPYSKNCPLIGGARKALSLEQLQIDASKKLGLSHIGIGVMAYLAETSGKENIDELARVLHMAPEKAQLHESYIRETLIPKLRGALPNISVRKQEIRASLRY